MANKQMNVSGNNGENQEKGRELYNKDKEHTTGKRYGYRGTDDRQWGEGNHFHTGPNPRGAENNSHFESNDYRSNRSTYNSGHNAHLNDHYGSRSDSAYRNADSYLDHGGSNRHEDDFRGGNIGGSQPGNFNEPPKYRDETWREHPGGRSRYKESDYRYGSGSHNWYREGRYTPDVDNKNQYDDRGFFQRMGDNIREGWNDIMHSDDPNYHDQQRGRRHDEGISSRERHGSEPFRNRSFDRGYEGGPRWADETDSGHDNYYNNTDRDQRYRR